MQGNQPTEAVFIAQRPLPSSILQTQRCVSRYRASTRPEALGEESEPGLLTPTHPLQGP